MAERYVDLDLATGLNDGTSWANARQDNAGFSTALTAANLTAGDNVWVQGDTVTTSGITPTAIATIATWGNPVKVYGVKAGTTAEPPAQSDLIPGIRTGNATRAYDQTAGNAAPVVTIGSPSDFNPNGNLYFYGLVFVLGDDFHPASSSAALSNQLFEECSFTISGVNDILFFGNSDAARTGVELRFRHCKLVASNAASFFRLEGSGRYYYDDCDLDLANTGGCIEGVQFDGVAIFNACDLSGCTSPMVDIAGFEGGRVEFHNCKMPATHVLTTGTAASQYTVANYGSDDQTGLATSNSEQILEIETREGTVDLETTVVRTGTLADDKATGAFSWALTPNNVTDNVVGVVSPWMDFWISGDGTAKTITVEIANTAGITVQSDEAYLELAVPSEAGDSMYDFWPDDGAAGDGGGLMQLLGTAADLTASTEAWGGGSPLITQKLTQSVAPDYQGPARARVRYSRSGSDLLYVDPIPVVT